VKIEEMSTHRKKELLPLQEQRRAKLAVLCPVHSTYFELYRMSTDCHWIHQRLVAFARERSEGGLTRVCPLPQHRLSCRGRFMRDRIVAKGTSPEKIAVIPPWSHDHAVRFDAAGRELFRAAHKLQGKFVVMYSGNHSPVHPLDTLMQAAEKLAKEPSIVFCFIGGGSEFKRVRQWAGRGKRSNVLCLPYQPLDQLSASLSAADAHVVVMGSGFVGIVHPCKIYNILAVGAPVIYIGPQPSHATEILDGLASGHPQAGVQHGEAERLAGQIRRLATGSGNTRWLSLNTAAALLTVVLLPKLISTMENDTSSGASAIVRRDMGSSNPFLQPARAKGRGVLLAVYYA
jgi:glycosyltransferase involved in cell wall biosynthesis